MEKYTVETHYVTAKGYKVPVEILVQHSDSGKLFTYKHRHYGVLHASPSYENVPSQERNDVYEVAQVEGQKLANYLQAQYNKHHIEKRYLVVQHLVSPGSRMSDPAEDRGKVGIGYAFKTKLEAERYVELQRESRDRYGSFLIQVIDVVIGE